MLKIFSKVIIGGLFITTMPVFSQEALVTIQNEKGTEQPVVNIKWYSQDFVYREGVNVYRNETDKQDWVKINDKPIKQWAEMPKNELDKDSSLRLFVEIMKNIRPDQLNGMVLLHLMAESFANPLFCRYIGIQYDDRNVIANQKYRYKVMRLTGGRETLLSTSDEIIAGSFVPKESPKNFFAKQFRKSVCMGWDTQDERFYAVNVYRKDKTGKEIMLNHKPVTISMIRDSLGKYKYPVNKYMDDSVKAGQIYEYRIAGVDFFGNETMYTPPVKVAVKDVTLPSPPKNVSKKINSLTVSLTWENTEFKKLSGFNVYRSSNDSNDYAIISPVLLPPAVTTYADAVPKSGGYYYMVSSVDTAGNENFSDKVFADVADRFPPAPPQDVTAIADTGCIRLSWTPNTEPDLMGYQVYRTINSDNTSYYVLLNTIAIREPHYTDSLPGNTRNRFFYKITAVDTSFNRSKFSAPVSAKMPDVVPPTKPFIRNIYQLTNYLVVEWIPNAEPDLAGYEIYRSVKGTKVNYQKINEGLIDREVTRFTDRYPVPDSTYNYYMAAIDSAGNRSLASDYFTATLVATGKDLEKSTIQSFKIKSNRKKGNRMQWNISTTKDFIGLTVYRKTSDDETPMKITDLFTGKEYTDRYKGASNPSYQLRLYHKSGQVVKSDWASVK